MTDGFIISNELIKIGIGMSGRLGSELSIRYRSAPNIALVKYWGKYDEDEILPINDSIGITLNSQDLSTITSCAFRQDIPEDQFWLNGKLVPITGRMHKVLAKIKAAARASSAFQTIKEEEWSQLHFDIKSENSFPTASGMASSASGFSCLATALNGLFGGILEEREVSRLARWGSGSAARAVHGGLVKWEGVDEQDLRGPPASAAQLEQLSRKCISYTIKPAQELSYLKVIILLTDNKEKEVSSTLGMQLSAQTSDLIKLRNGIARERISKVEQVLSKIDQARQDGDVSQEYALFGQLSELIIRDSNQFHAICLDTYPPIFYLNDFSKAVISLVDNHINRHSHCKLAYSFDAGAHAFLFLHENTLHQTLHFLADTFQLQEEAFNAKAKHILAQPFQPNVNLPKYDGRVIKPTQLWVTDVGRGAEPIEQ